METAVAAAVASGSGDGGGTVVDTSAAYVSIGQHWWVISGSRTRRNVTRDIRRICIADSATAATSAAAKRCANSRITRPVTTVLKMIGH